MKKEKGFILIFTLCITALISLLVLSSMKNLMLYQRATTKREMEHRDFYQLEGIARQLIHASKTRLEPCSYHQDQANHSIMQLIEKQGCQLTIQKRIYWYLVEDLGIYPCLMIVSAKSLYSSHHFRFTVLTPATPEHKASLVQLRVLKLAKLQQCSESISYVNPGISSWRYLPNIDLES